MGGSSGRASLTPMATNSSQRESLKITAMLSVMLVMA